MNSYFEGYNHVGAPRSTTWDGYAANHSALYREPLHERDTTVGLNYEGQVNPANIA